MKLLLLSLLLFSCATHKGTLYIKGENHQAHYDKKWKQYTQDRAKQGEVNLLREGYFPEELINQNTYGIDDPKIYNLSNALRMFSDIDFALTTTKLTPKEKEDYINRIRNSVFLYEEINYFKKIKHKLSLIINRDTPLTTLLESYKKVIIHHSQNDFKQYQKALNQYITEKTFSKKNIDYLWDNIVIKARDKKMADNIYRAYNQINNDKDIIVIVGSRHTQGIMKYLKEKGLKPQELKIIKRKKNRF